MSFNQDTDATRFIPSRLASRYRSPERSMTMKEKRNYHLKVQELCDCYATTDPLQEMSRLPSDQDKEEGALKWLALTALHGINNNASKITIRKAPGEAVKVTAEYRRTELPSPGDAVGERIFDTLREITHIDEAKGKTLLALGLRDSSVDLRIKVKSKEGREKISIKFPD
jgi:hypothetical protein